MTRCLLDVNVLLALVDPAHVQFNTVHGWFAQPEKASLPSRHGRVTDSCLLALAKANRGKLATLDHKLSAEVVADGKSALALITHAWSPMPGHPCLVTHAWSPMPDHPCLS